jgi:hypothetical protein
MKGRYRMSEIPRKFEPGKPVRGELVQANPGFERVILRLRNGRGVDAEHLPVLAWRLHPDGAVEAVTHPPCGCGEIITEGVRFPESDRVFVAGQGVWFGVRHWKETIEKIVRERASAKA